MSINEKLLSDLLNSIKIRLTFVRYMHFFHFLNAEYGLEDIRKRQLKISRLDDLNDPFEFLGADLSDKVNRIALHNTKTELSKTRGLLCFSRNWRTPALWGHYADKHKGLCLGFKMPKNPPKQVAYVNSRPSWPSEIDEQFVQNLLFTKFVHWSYEDEYRAYAILEDEENGLFYAKFSASLVLKQVIIGAESTITRDQISEALGNMQSKVEVFKARAAFKSFQMVRNKDESLWA